MKEHKPYITSLFEKYLEGTYTEDELDILLEYFKMDKNSAQLKYLIEEEFHKAIPDSVDLNKIKDDLEQLRPDVLKAIGQPKRHHTWWYAAAAVLFFFSIAISTYVVIHKKKESQTLSSQYGQDVLPGSNKAIISLSDGSQYELNGDQTGITIAEDGITYTNGELITATDKVITAVIEVPRGGMYNITLQDGTKVSLNSASTLRYPVRFTGSERRVELEGEGYFDVVRNPDQPFIVTTNGQELKVLGTAFNIRNYHPKTVTTLIHGKIELINKNTEEQVILSPGQQASISAKDTKVAKVDPSEFIAWKEGFILIKDADLWQVCDELERWYDVRFKFQEGFNSNERAFLSFDRNVVLSTVLLSLEKTYGVQFSINGKEVRVNQKK